MSEHAAPTYYCRACRTLSSPAGDLLAKSAKEWEKLLKRQHSETSVVGSDTGADAGAGGAGARQAAVTLDLTFFKSAIWAVNEGWSDEVVAEAAKRAVAFFREEPVGGAIGHKKQLRRTLAMHQPCVCASRYKFDLVSLRQGSTAVSDCDTTRVHTSNRVHPVRC